MAIFIKKNKDHFTKDKEIVIIFDECHHSQFGKMHIAITKFFKQYYLFGFTGTPIFAINASLNSRLDLKTTEQAFGRRLHGLLQAFSRTNRILNSVKTFGNIVSFRNLEKATNESLSLFSDKNINSIVSLRTFE